MSWETTIGLEIHVQLSTKTKLFSGASTQFGSNPNTQVDYVDLGLPGVLPVPNREAFKKAIMFGLATNSTINNVSFFDRKNYFYPDLPKGYQITQMALPIVGKGSIKIEVEGQEKIINITSLLQCIIQTTSSTTADYLSNISPRIHRRVLIGFLNWKR